MSSQSRSLNRRGFRTTAIGASVGRVHHRMYSVGSTTGHYDDAARAIQLVKWATLLAAICLSTHQMWDLLAYYGRSHRFLYMFLFFGIWILAISSIAILSGIRSLALRLPWILMLTASSLVSDLHFRVMHTYINLESVMTFWEARTGAADAFVTYRSEVVYSFLVAAILFTAMLASPSIEMKGRFKHWLSVSPLIPMSAIYVVFWMTAGAGIRALPGQFSFLPLVLGAALEAPPANRDEVTIPKVRDSLVDKIVLIVDESVRGDFIDLSGASRTTPFLASIKDQVIDFGLALSGSNCSVQSNAILRMGANPRTLGTKEGDIRKNPTIWAYAKTAGFSTAYVDDQMENGQLSSYMNEAEVSEIDGFVQMTGPGYQKDISAINTVVWLLNSHPNAVIYWNKQGAHTPYESRYPAEFGRFNPRLETTVSSVEDRERLTNSYKNAISWTVDHFFQSLLGQVDLKHTLIIYTSDHGQNLLDDGTTRTHCGLTDPNFHEALVPLLVFNDTPSLRPRLVEAAALNRNRSSHFQIFPTILEVLGFASQRTKEKYFSSLFESTAGLPGFTYGPIFGYMGRGARWASYE